MSLYDFDKTTIVGRVGKDAEMRYTSSGTAITSFSVAVDRSFKKDGDLVKRTIWYRISVFGKFAETCKSIAKGDRVLVEGNLTPDENGGPRIWSKQDGTQGTSFELMAQTVRFLSSKDKTKQTEKSETEAEAEDYPF